MMAERIGVAINPHILAMLFRVEARITGKNGFAVRLAEDCLPEDYQLMDCDYNRNLGQFWMVFARRGDPVPGPVRWLSPVFEKEEQNETDPERPGF